MKKIKRSITRKKQKGIAIMTLSRTIVLGVVIVAAAAVAALLLLGPKMGLQTPPIEPKAMSYLQEHNMLHNGESITGYKAISYYNYDKAAVVTTQRLFVYNGKEVFSIPLDKITKVTIKDRQLGHQQVLISAQQNGAIDFELNHSSVPTLINLLHVPSTSVVYVDAEPASNATAGTASKI